MTITGRVQEAQQETPPSPQRPRGRNTTALRLTLIRGVKHDPVFSIAVARLAAAQRMAYNQAVIWLKREPRLDLFKTSAKPHRASLQGRLSLEIQKSRAG